MAPGYPDKKPFDVSFQPTPMLSPTAPACPFGIVGIDVVIPSTPQLSPPHNSLDVIEKVSANAEVHHQSYEQEAEVEARWEQIRGRHKIIRELLTAGHVLFHSQLMAMVALALWLDNSCMVSDPAGHSLHLPLQQTQRDSDLRTHIAPPPAAHGIVPPLASIRWKQNRTRALSTVTRTRLPPRMNNCSSN
ncbi:hypothetical protein THAOC_02771 [Thalassiosira oceanica]|uniref:Uncharacterized protein n=1 Tax=Thalassiosira oceanica TaxID=159749 RepID=K0TED7_THAOC|nr:hypothetical protein THAOC_02771 [Thalassiosira oceanica]|eukprot:EJK75504.1 hypothetical protein THAOC_02771 [Thalassiosira oceanica]